MMRFDGKVAIITGGGRGIGKAHAELLASRGCKVLINDAGIESTGEETGEDPASQLAESIRAAGGEALAHRGNVLDSGPEMVAKAIKEWGRLDILICNAGASRGGLFGQQPTDEWHAMFDIHVKGTVNVAHAAWPHLVKSGAGRVLTTASNGAFGNPYATSYGAAKAALFGLTKSLSKEGAAHGIHVNCILPAAWTRMTQKISDPVAQRALESRFAPEEIASFAAWLVHQDTAVNSEAFHIGAGVAQRAVFALSDPTVLDNPSPEDWAAVSDRLLTDKVTPIDSLMDAFAGQILAINPELADDVDAMRRGGVKTRAAN